MCYMAGDNNFLCKIKSFPIFNVVYIPKLGFSREKNENLGESPAVREEHPFSLPKFGNFHFLNLVRGSEIMKA